MITDLTANRTLGAFPISIGTSIALEHICGVKTEANPDPKEKDIQNYREFWFNIKTLYRNLIGALDKNSSKEILADEMADALHHEMEVISNVVSEYSAGTCNAVFYLSNYVGIEKRFKMATIKGDHTANQLAYAALMRLTLKQLLQKGNKVGNSEIKIFDLHIKPSGQYKTLILTHIAYDLVSNTSFGSLALIESHTGSVKARDKWHTKYYDGKELSAIPFVEGLLPVFGDSEFFKPLPKAARNSVLELARQYHWSSVTSREKILYSIDKLKNPYLKEVITSFFH